MNFIHNEGARNFVEKFRIPNHSATVRIIFPLTVRLGDERGRVTARNVHQPYRGHTSFLGRTRCVKKARENHDDAASCVRERAFMQHIVSTVFALLWTLCGGRWVFLLPVCRLILLQHTKPHFSEGGLAIASASRIVIISDAEIWRAISGPSAREVHIFDGNLTTTTGALCWTDVVSVRTS